ncbi:hypothetical protein EDD37DRAFT_641123 [Exophiala viscosa]|uniref:uncharacterized protein n=1 Tax=Exophiala viscosa TaxID=2486360 RepID=UPI0021943203|nr:hypothetical protein EDD37DRAFT_641123 [Exophiala viscosa]
MTSAAPTGAEPYVTLKLSGNPEDAGRSAGKSFNESLLYANFQEMRKQNPPARVAAGPDDSTNDAKPVAPKPYDPKSMIEFTRSKTRRGNDRDSKQEENKPTAGEEQESWTVVKNHPDWVQVEDMGISTGNIIEGPRDEDTLVWIAHNTNKSVREKSQAIYPGLRNMVHDINKGGDPHVVAAKYYGSSWTNVQDLVRGLAKFAAERDKEACRLAEDGDWEMPSEDDNMKG